MIYNLCFQDVLKEREKAIEALQAELTEVLADNRMKEEQVKQLNTQIYEQKTEHKQQLEAQMKYKTFHY